MTRHTHLFIGLLAILGALVPVTIAASNCRVVRSADRTQESPCDGSGVAKGCSAYVACPQSDQCVETAGGFQFCKIFAVTLLPCKNMIGGAPDPQRPGCCYNGIEIGDSELLNEVTIMTGGGGPCTDFTNPIGPQS